MYSIDEKILQAYASDSREIYVRATFNDTVIVTGNDIKSFTVTDSVGSTDSLSLGNTCSKKLELDMFVPEGLTGIAKAKIKIEIGIDIDGEAEYTPLGVFYVDDYKTTNDYKSVKITAFDAMLKIYEQLGDTYSCGLSSTEVTPVEVIEDICSQAGVSVSIGDETEEKTVLCSRNAEGVLYATNGTKYDSLCSIGTSDLIVIPKDCKSINIKIFGLAEAGMTFSDFRALYFKDAEGTSRHSYSDYGFGTFGDVFDFDNEGTIIQYIEGIIYPPTYAGTLYLGFHFNTSQFETLPDSLYFEITTKTDETNYVNGDVSISNPQKVEVSARDMLGYMAGILGCNAVIDRTGTLTVRKLILTSVRIPYELQYMNGLEKTHETVLPIEYLTTGSAADEDGNGGTITVGSGSYGFNFENPYITSESVAQNILNLYKDLEILPCNINYRGNPSIDCGDIISVQDKDLTYYNVLVLNNAVTVTGGLSAKIDCGLKTDVKKDFISVPSSKRIEHKIEIFIAAYQDVIQELVGVKGGYVQRVRDTNNVVRAVAITQSNIQVMWDETNGKVVTVNSSDKGTPMWVWSYGGLSFSPNGGTSYNTAINMSGQIYAEMIVGKLSKFVELQAESGTIGGWTINDTSMYSDYTDSNGNTYRAFIQKPISDKQWAFSTQQKSGDVFIGKFIVMANGETYVPRLYDDKSRTLIAYNDDDGYFVYGLGAYQNNYDTYYEGNTIYLRYKNDLRIQEGTTTRFTFANVGWKFSDIDSSYVKRNTITTPGGFVLNANGGNNAIYLNANTTYAYCKFRMKSSLTVDGKITTPATINANGGITVDGGSYITLGKNSSGVYLNGNSNNLYLSGSSYVQSDSQFRLNFKASSGTVPLAVGTSGQITTTSSSERYKENITDELDDDLNPEKLYDLPVKQYNYKPEYSDIELVAGTQIGIIAEDVEKYYPNALIRNTEGEAESWQDRIMIPAMLKLIQQQKKEIDLLKEQNSKTEERLAALETVVSNLVKE